MQFIPSTWQLAGRDGNGDGTADPFNIDDAALSAATCLALLRVGSHDKGGLRTTPEPGNDKGGHGRDD